MIFIITVVAVLGLAVFVKPTQVIQPVASGITLAQVATHTSTSNCWMIISGNVYNVTNYILIHPGGPGQIISFCGKDATVAFDTKGGRGPHSQTAQNMLTQYYVGVLAR